MSELPAWIRPGTEVLCYTRSQHRNLRRTRIAKVAKKSFTVERPEEPRFRIATQDAYQGGDWGWTRCVIPLDSDKASELIEEARRARLVRLARTAADRYDQSPTRENRLAAIEALSKVED